MTGEMTAKDRDALIRFARAQARQAEREVDTRMAVCRAEVVDQMTAVFAADDALWKEAVLLAQEEMEKANAHIRNQVAALGIPPTEARRSGRTGTPADRPTPAGTAGPSSTSWPTPSWPRWRRRRKVRSAAPYWRSRSS